MELESYRISQWVVVTIRGRLDGAAAPRFEQEMDKRTTEGNTRFVMDLGALEYISSAGLRGLLTLAKKLKDVKGKLVFCNLRGMVAEVFSVSGFSSMFSLFDSLETALKQG
jgi:anti-anti-sigma factor